MERLSIDRQTEVVFVYLGVNDAQALWLAPHERTRARRRWIAWADRRWNEVYERRVRRFIERICARGARRVIVLPPVDVVQPRLEQRLKRVRELQTRAASASSCGMAIATRGDRGRFDAGGRARRRRDGFHMTELGARIVWERIRDRALRSAARDTARSDAPPLPGSRAERGPS